MCILAIETSCDETAVCIVEAEGDPNSATFKILGNALYSQAALHAPYGGVFPTLAKREHQNNLAPLTREALTQAGLFHPRAGLIERVNSETGANARDEHFKKTIEDFLNECEKPALDMIAVTHGPGLEPALWTGITFAEALGAAWGVPVLGIDHMEGHIVSALLKQVTGNRLQGTENSKSEPVTYHLSPVTFPMLALLISGGHTELVLMKGWFTYEHIGTTRDDAIGEAFDKVARLLELSYPGGPHIAALAKKARARGGNPFTFPRPMAKDATCDFSFSGLKTAVLYKLKSMEKISEEDKEHIAEAFENSARDIIVIKTKRALTETMAQALLVGGGVSANEEIRKALGEMIERDFPGLALHFPDKALTGDNAIMIGAAAYLRSQTDTMQEKKLTASGNLRLNPV